jgi:hypothetical protein
MSGMVIIAVAMAGFRSERTHPEQVRLFRYHQAQLPSLASRVEGAKDILSSNERTKANLEQGHMIIVWLDPANRDDWIVELKSLRNQIQYHEREAARLREYLFPWELREETKRADVRNRR